MMKEMPGKPPVKRLNERHELYENIASLTSLQRMQISGICLDDFQKIVHQDLILSNEPGIIKGTGYDGSLNWV